jgi:S1-C subfamily serine protease
VVTAVDGKPVTTITSLTELLASAKPGQKVKVDFVRDGAKTSAEATLGEI